MRRNVVEFDHWRHYVPELPEGDIEFSVISGKSGEYFLPKNIILQGARDPKTHVSPSIDLEVTPAQRGWRIVFVPITLPKHGTVESTTNGFKYNAFSPVYEGEDYFHYILSNGTQESKVGTVKITISRGYYPELKIKKLAANNFKFSTVKIIGKGLPAPKDYACTVTLTKPAKVWNPDLERWQVGSETLTLASYAVLRYEVSHQPPSWDSMNDHHHTNNCVWKYICSPDGLDWSHYFDADYELKDLPVGDTDVKYVPNGDCGKLLFTYTLWMERLGFAPSLTVDYDITDVYGERWWECGNLLNDTPDTE